MSFDSYLWQTVQKKQEFIAQIMSSKSPVRSYEDVDATALSYSEIKALCAGNPLIAEKMTLDNDVARLRMLKSERQSQHYRLEDDLLKRFPGETAAVTERIAGIEKDAANYAAEKAKCVEVLTGETDGAVSVNTKFPGMTVNGVTHTEKEPAANALLEACKGVKGKNTDVPVGEYMGFQLSLRYENFGQQINLLIRGAMTYQIDMGTDALGNMTRINNALEKLPERLDGAKSQLADIHRQMEAAKMELAKPFEQEAELAEKEARLALLNADLNIDGDGGLDVMNDAENRDGTEPDEAYIDDAPDDGRDPPAQTNDGCSDEYGSPPMSASAKAKPSILSHLRSYTGQQKPPLPGGRVSDEIDI